MAPRLIVYPLVSLLAACGGAQQQRDVIPYQQPSYGEPTPPPEWLSSVGVDADRLCGFGVAGAGYDQHSPYPKRLAEERAVKNLAGVLGTRVQEAIIDRQTADNVSVTQAKVLTVDDALIEKVGALATTEFWIDATGEGPYANRGFVYAHTCMAAQVAASNFAIDAHALAEPGDASLVTPEEIPGWLDDYGTRPDGRLCAIGFSLPTYHPDKTFANVVDDVRWQLAEVIQTFVSSYYEELTTEHAQSIEAMTLATTEAVSKGAIVTHYWYDRDGIGPVKKERSTYGYGCVYPVQILQTSAAQVEPTAPEDERRVIAKVRERADSAFGDLDAEIDRRERAATASASAPASEPEGAPPNRNDTHSPPAAPAPATTSE